MAALTKAREFQTHRAQELLHSLFNSCIYCVCPHIPPSCCTRGGGWGGVWPVSTLVHPNMHYCSQYWTGRVWAVSTLHESLLHSILWPILDRLGMLLLGCGLSHFVAEANTTSTRGNCSAIYSSVWKWSFRKLMSFYLPSARTQKLFVAVYNARTLSSKWEMEFEHVASA